jgi:hypothetical protein
MPAVPYVFRRGAVYWWRRRLPQGCGGRPDGSVQLSLAVRDLSAARPLAAHLTAVSEEMGVEFLFEGAKGIGVRVRKEPKGRS